MSLHEMGLVALKKKQPVVSSFWNDSIKKICCTRVTTGSQRSCKPARLHSQLVSYHLRTFNSLHLIVKL